MLIFLDSISYFLAGLIYRSSKMITVFSALSSTILVIFFNTIINRFVEKTEAESLPISKIIFFFLITMFHLFLVFVFSEIYVVLKNDFFKTIIMVIIICQVLINLFIYRHLEYVNKSYRIEKQMIESSKQNELKNIYYMGLKDKYEENRKIIHDFKNYIQSLETAYKNEDSKLSNNIRTQIYEKLETKNIKYKTSSDILDILLEDKEAIAIKEMIKFIFLMEILDLSFIKELDIVIIFGNLYDNAIEACRDVEDNRYIETKIYLIQEMIVIKIVNTCSNELKYKNNKLCSTKDKHSGLGTSNIDKTVKKYNGIFNIKIENNLCTSVISIPINIANN
ncbi:MAG: ATP-binding protein [Bacilli bacterium]